MIILVVSVGYVIMANKSDSNPAINSTGNSTGNSTMAKKVLLETTMGNITIELASDMPITAGNFETLVTPYFSTTDLSI